MCRLTEWLVFCLPLRRWKDAVRRRHLARCPRCAAEDKALENAVHAFLTPAWTRDNPGLETKVRRRLVWAEGAPGAEKAGRRLLLRVAVGAALIFLSVGGWILFHHRDAGRALPGAVSNGNIAGSGPRVRVFSAELRGKPAKTYIYQTPKISIVLISPSKEIGGRP
jgi:hypothetical protein